MPIEADARARARRHAAAHANADVDVESDADGHAFGLAVRGWRERIGLSLNQLARRAGVDPAYIHRIEAQTRTRPPLPRRAVVLAIASALELNRRQTDELLAQAGYVPEALVELGGWDPTLAAVAELLADSNVSGPAKADLRELLTILMRRWGPSEPPELGQPRAELK